MVVRLVVESLHAAATREHDLGPRHYGSFAVEAVLVVKYLGGIAAAHADVGFEQQACSKQIGPDAVAPLADETIGVGDNRQRTVEQMVVRNLGHRLSFD